MGRGSYVCLIFLFSGLLFSCGDQTKKTDPPPAETKESHPKDQPAQENLGTPVAIFLVTGQTEGRLEPCGCSVNPAGGVSRREGVASALKEEFPDVPVVFLETGSFLSYRNPAAHVFNKTLMDWMGHAGYVATGVGDTDLIKGVDNFHQQTEGLDIAFLAANVVNLDGTKPFDGSTTFTLSAGDGGPPVRIGIIGLAGPIHSPKFEIDSDLRFTDPAIAGAEEYQALMQPGPNGEPAPDLVFLLGTITPDAARPVVRALENVDLYAFSSDIVLTKEIQQAGKKRAPLFYTGDLGRRMFELHLYRQGDTYRWQTRNLYLGRDFPESAHWDQRVKETILAANTVNKKLLTGHVVTKKPGDRAYFDTSESETPCASCHPEAAKVWQDSRHGRAMKTLVVKNQNYNPECLPCHTTGMDRWDGFVTPDDTPNRVNVQCESCHGPRDGHPVFEREKRTKNEKLAVDPATRGELLCRSCHTKEDSPEFTFADYWPKIAHGLE